jgi:hypothetical protein
VQAVGLDLVGFDLPVAVSTLIVAGLAVYRGFRIGGKSLVYYAIVFLGISFTSVTLFYAAPNPRTLNIPGDWSLLFMLASGVAYSAFFMSRRAILVGMVECYAIGTFAMVLCDVIRTWVIGLPVSLPVVYFGGDGFGDMVLNLGVCMQSTFATVSALQGVWDGNLVEKVIGARRAARFWQEYRGLGHH